jgi:hypothetical protein
MVTTTKGKARVHPASPIFRGRLGSGVVANSDTAVADYIEAQCDGNKTARDSIR